MHKSKLLRRLFLAGWLLALTLLTLQAGTVMIMRTSLGDMEFELFDQDKPVTVSNFVGYVERGDFDDLFVNRWSPGFVIQAGQFAVADLGTTNAANRVVNALAPIPNEYSIGEQYSNTYGTIAMARQGGVTNS